MLQRRGLAACYLIEHNGMAGFIDTGTSRSIPIMLEVLRRKHIAADAVAYVMPTHVHLDHAGGAGSMMQAFPNATLLVHPRGARHLIEPTKLQAGSLAVYGEAAFTQMFGRIEPVPQQRVKEVPDGFELDFYGRKLVFVHTEGHARHHYCIYDETSEGLFTGDTFGASYPELNYGKAPFIFPPTTPVQFDPIAWVATLDRLMLFAPQRVFLTHFGMHANVEKLFKLLRQSIQDYADLAEEFRTLESHESRLSEALLQQSTNYLLDQQCGVDSETIRALIGNDMALNAQGLVHWLTLN